MFSMLLELYFSIPPLTQCLIHSEQFSLEDIEYDKAPYYYDYHNAQNSKYTDESKELTENKKRINNLHHLSIDLMISK